MKEIFTVVLLLFVTVFCFPEDRGPVEITESFDFKIGINGLGCQWAEGRLMFNAFTFADDFTIFRHQGIGYSPACPIKFDPYRVKFLKVKPGMDISCGEMTADVQRWCTENWEFLPEKFEGKIIIFPGTLFQDKKGTIFVPYLLFREMEIPSNVTDNSGWVSFEEGIIPLDSLINDGWEVYLIR